jgi:hypothetical protein
MNDGARLLDAAKHGDVAEARAALDEGAHINCLDWTVRAPWPSQRCACPGARTRRDLSLRR